MSFLKNKSSFFFITSIMLFPLLSFVNFDNTHDNLFVLSLMEEGSSPRKSLSSITQGPIIGLPAVSPLNPGSDEDTSVSVSINDTDGVKNASLYWEYLVNGTQSNTSMALDSVVRAIATTFTADEEGEIADVAPYNKTGPKSEWMSGNYTFVSLDAINKINLNITSGGPQDSLVYVRIEIKNISTGDWDEKLVRGELGGTLDLVKVNYSLNNYPVLGCRIIALTYRNNQNAKAPVFDQLLIHQVGFVGVVPAARQPTYVSYYIIAFDELDNPTTSGSYTFLMDWAPQVTILNPPSAFSSVEDYNFEIGAIDPDGAGSIGNVYGYYREVGNINWTNFPLEYFGTFADTAYYNGTLATDFLIGLETEIEVKVNVTDTMGKSGSHSITVPFDGSHPKLNSILVEGGVSGIENVTLATSEVNITAEFIDGSGISQVIIYYAIPNGTSPAKKEMVNITDKDSTITSTTFFVTLPPANITTFVEYFFETSDYSGLQGNTSANVYYADAAAPLLNSINFSQIITNATDAIILFNASDISGVDNSVLWYRYENASTWQQVAVSNLDYSNPDLINYEGVFEPIDVLPFVIQDNQTSNLTVELTRGGSVHSAILDLEIEHELSTDLRIWLLLDDGQRLLIFDREPDPSTTIRRTIDLFNLGLEEDDFDKGNFTFEIHDYSNLYSGSIKQLSIRLKEWKIPLGYQFIAIIPKSGNDTDVSFYISLTDDLGNADNSSIFQYYSDGLPPEISFTPLESILNLDKASYIYLEVSVSDKSGIFEVEVYTFFGIEVTTPAWDIKLMHFDPETNMYIIDIPIPTTNGTLWYKIRTYDNVGHATETQIYSVEYENGRITPPGTPDLGPLLTVLAGSVILISGIAGIIYLL
ncbi:MAG: hypothetical protein ACXAD7_20015, partial [Candidatus Kariarchaeaceae archaeon]